MTGWATALRRRLAERPRERFEVAGFRQAAVLVPLLDASSGLELLFTERSSALSNHAGQIAFPGGRLEPGETVEAAARRETLEEVGLEVPPSALLGRLDEHPSPAGYVVTPVVALLPWPQPLRLNPAEVGGAFTVPLSQLRALVPRVEERHTAHFSRHLHFYDYGDKLIWGLTGNVLKSLLDLLEPEPSEVTSS